MSKSKKKKDWNYSNTIGKQKRKRLPETADCGF